MEHVQEGVTRDKIQSLMSNETWFDSKKMQQYFNVEIEEKAAVAACASDYFEKSFTMEIEPSQRNGVKWLYVVYKNIVGYASSKYLSK